MTPIETIPGLGRGVIKENDGGVNSSMIYLLYCRNISKCHNAPTHSTTIKNFFKKFF
jgi:hypothetical protein